MADECLVGVAPALRTGMRPRELFDAGTEPGTISFDDDTRIFAGHRG